MNSPIAMADFQLAIRSAVAAGLAVAIARFLRLAFPLYAMIAAIIVTDLVEPQPTCGACEIA